MLVSDNWTGPIPETPLCWTDPSAGEGGILLLCPDQVRAHLWDCLEPQGPQHHGAAGSGSRGGEQRLSGAGVALLWRQAVRTGGVSQSGEERL